MSEEKKGKRNRSVNMYVPMESTSCLSHRRKTACENYAKMSMRKSSTMSLISCENRLIANAIPYLSFIVDRAMQVVIRNFYHNF